MDKDQKQFRRELTTSMIEHDTVCTITFTMNTSGLMMAAAAFHPGIKDECKKMVLESIMSNAPEMLIAAFDASERDKRKPRTKSQKPPITQPDPKLH